jgi:hypothetical protein
LCVKSCRPAVDGRRVGARLSVSGAELTNSRDPAAPDLRALAQQLGALASGNARSFASKILDKYRRSEASRQKPKNGSQENFRLRSRHRIKKYNSRRLD